MNALSLRLAGLGLVTWGLTVLPANAEDRFDDVRSLRKSNIPVTGTLRLEKLDEAILDFMVAKGIPAVSCAISRKKELIHDRAYGWADPALKTPLPLGTAMRLGPLTKPITQAAVRTLIASGQLKLDESVFEVLQLQSLVPAKSKFDPRWRKITVAHLLDNAGGWLAEKPEEAGRRCARICKNLGIDLAQMTAMDLVRWQLTLPLDFDPGQPSGRSDFADVLLGCVVEKVARQSLSEYANAMVAPKVGMTTLRLSRSDVKDRLPGEIWYCFHPELIRKQVVFPARLEAEAGANGLACSATDYCRFLDHYNIRGEAQVQIGYGGFSGGPFGACVTGGCREDDITYVALCNRRSGLVDEWHRELTTLIEQTLHDLEKSR